MSLPICKSFFIILNILFPFADFFLHRAHLVGSALSDTYLSFAADLNALSGSLSCTDDSQHGVPNVNIMDTIDPKQQHQRFPESALWRL